MTGLACDMACSMLRVRAGREFQLAAGLQLSYYRGMTKSISVIRPPKKRGRPPTEAGETPVMTLRVPKVIRDKFDRWAKDHDLSRSDAIRALIEQGLKK